MPDITRPSPRHKTVSLFATCMVDMVYTHVGVSTVRLLDYLGVQTTFPQGQTCCGQPAFNAGFWDDARPVARHFLTTFAEADVIVAPSGSCAAMIRHHYPLLFRDDPHWYAQAVRAASITWELTEFIVDGLGMSDLGLALPATRVAFHDACHGLHQSGLGWQARALATAVDGVTPVEMPDSDVCCGFGGAFSVKMPDVSGAMLRDKMEAIAQTAADRVITGDSGCIAHINGGLSHNGREPIMVHIADFLAAALPSDAHRRS